MQNYTNKNKTKKKTRKSFDRRKYGVSGGSYIVVAPKRISPLFFLPFFTPPPPPPPRRHVPVAPRVDPRAREPRRAVRFTTEPFRTVYRVITAVVLGGGARRARRFHDDSAAIIRPSAVSCRVYCTLYVVYCRPPRVCRQYSTLVWLDENNRFRPI